MTTTRTEAPGFDAAVARAAALSWRRRQHERVCDHVEAWRHGRLVRASALPAYWDFNAVVVDDDAADLSVDELARVAELHSAGLAHRQVQVLSERAGERLRL